MKFIVHLKRTDSRDVGASRLRSHIGHKPFISTARGNYHFVEWHFVTRQKQEAQNEDADRKRVNNKGSQKASTRAKNTVTTLFFCHTRHPNFCGDVTTNATSFSHEPQSRKRAVPNGRHQIEKWVMRVSSLSTLRKKKKFLLLWRPFQQPGSCLRLHKPTHPLVHTHAAGTSAKCLLYKGQLNRY